ncbi:MAG: hypothetical protein ACK52M_06165 [bacterium]|jgi:hypothetical protein
MSVSGQPPASGPGDGPAGRRADDAELARLLDRRSPLSVPLRAAAAADGPPGAVDAAIRAAARRAVAAGPQPLPHDGSALPGGSGRPRPWWHAARLPIAAAAMLVVTVSVTLLVDREQRAPQSAPEDLRTGVAAPASSALPSAAVVLPEGLASGPGRDGRSPAARPAVAPAAPVPSVEPMVPVPAPTAGATFERPAADYEPPSTRRSVAPMAAPPPPPPQAAASGTATPAEAASLPPDRWLQRILELRSSGRTQEAAEALAAFRKAWPGHPLPPELAGTP